MEVKAEVISWTTATTQTYLTPSFTFTPANEFVTGIIFNDTGITLTHITIATWSLKEQIPYGDVSIVEMLKPNQTITFAHTFSSLDEEVSPDSIHVGVQGIASP